MKGKMIRFIDNLDRNKTGRVMFGTGMIGFMISGCCLDSAYLGVALMGLMLSVAVCYIGHGMCDLSESFKWESRKTIERKQNNRECTYERWIQTTKPAMMKGDVNVL
jgi:hypothetical protein